MHKIQLWRSWRSCSGSSSTCSSVLIRVTENISRSTAKMCRNINMPVAHSWSDYQWYTFNSFCRLCKKKSWWWLPLNLCGKTCWPTKQWPHINSELLLVCTVDCTMRIILRSLVLVVKIDDAVCTQGASYVTSNDETKKSLTLRWTNTKRKK
jgi:hypothetical protein